MQRSVVDVPKRLAAVLTETVVGDLAVAPPARPPADRVPLAASIAGGVISVVAAPAHPQASLGDVLASVSERSAVAPKANLAEVLVEGPEAVLEVALKPVCAGVALEEGVVEEAAAVAMLESLQEGFVVAPVEGLVAPAAGPKADLVADLAVGPKVDLVEGLAEAPVAPKADLAGVLVEGPEMAPKAAPKAAPEAALKTDPAVAP